MKPGGIKFRKVSNPVISQASQLGFGSGITNCDNAAGAVLPGLPDRGQAVLDDHTVRQGHSQPTSGLEMHGSLIGIGAIIVDHILPLKPSTEVEGIKEEIDVGLDGGTC